jgi:hypothetical protein
MRRSICLGLLISAVTAFAAGCEDATPTPTTPTTPVLTTDTFSNTLTANGAVTFPFAVASSGPVTATLTTVSDATIVIGLSIGTWNGNACQVVLARDGAAAGDSIVGQASNLGNLCARVYDIGNVVAPITFTITVEHP